MPKGTDDGFINKLFSTLKDHKLLAKPRFSTTAFIVKHYAQDVPYEVQGFLEKNKDTISGFFFIHHFFFFLSLLLFLLFSSQVSDIVCFCINDLIFFFKKKMNKDELMGVLQATSNTFLADILSGVTSTKKATLGSTFKVCIYIFFYF